MSSAGHHFYLLAPNNTIHAKDGAVVGGRDLCGAALQDGGCRRDGPGGNHESDCHFRTAPGWIYVLYWRDSAVLRHQPHI